MAGVSTKEIKNRIRSMENTKQITRAMEMVASSKLRKAQVRVLSSRPYFESLYAAIHEILDANSEFTSPYLTARPVKKAAYIVIGGDRGLAGGYNSNVFKLTLSQMGDGEAVVLPIGKKTVEFFHARQKPLLTARYAEAESIGVGDCFSIAKQLCKGYLKEEYDEIFVAYTNFVSVLTQTPAVLRLLPLARQQTGKRRTTDIVYEPDSASVFDAITPEYIGGVLYGALCESRASEQAARRTAMDAATQNADEMIGQLSLAYNRARQASITQEITEIVAGA